MNEIINPRMSTLALALFCFSGLLWILAALIAGSEIVSPPLVPLASGIAAIALICAVGGIIRAISDTSEVFVINSRSFGFGGRDLCYRTELPHRIETFDQIEGEGIRSVVRLKDGGVVRFPLGLESRRSKIEALLSLHRQIAEVGSYDGPRGPVKQQPWIFSGERPIPVPEAGADDMTIDDPDSLRSLLHHYHALATYRDAIPSSFDLARLFTGLHRTNGGLALFGVQPGGSIVGLPEAEIARAQERLTHLAAKLTDTQVQIGRIELGGKVALYALFNPVVAHTGPMKSLESATSDIVVA